MCTPSNAIGAMLTTISYIGGYKEMKRNNEYRTQVALNNVQTARNEALRQQQLGIEKSRLETIEGMSELSKIKARNAASNLDSFSQTNELIYEDSKNLTNLNASAVKKQYDTNANSYFLQANNYLNQAQNYQTQYNQSLFNYSLNAVGKLHKVANNWYEDREKIGGQINDYI